MKVENQQTINEKMDLTTLSKSVQQEINKTQQICAVYGNILQQLINRSIEFNFDINFKQHINHEFYNIIMEQLTELRDFTKRFSDNLVNDSFQQLVNVFCEDNFNMFWNHKYSINHIQNLHEYQTAVAATAMNNLTIKTATVNNLTNIIDDVKSICIVVHTDKLNEIFYIYDISNDAKIQKLNEHFNQLNHIILNDKIIYKNMLPNIGIIFGYQYNGRLQRAIRENTIIYDNTKTYDIYLLDLGKEITIEITEKLYQLPLHLQEMPSVAIRCQLYSIKNYNNAIDVFNFYKTALNQKFLFNVMSVDMQTSKLVLKLENISNPFICYLNANECSWLDISHESATGTADNCEIVKETTDLKSFLENLINEDGAGAEKPQELNTSSKITTEKPQEVSATSKITDDYDNGNIDLILNSDDNFTVLTAEERKLLNEETFSTTNAMKAVLGYIPKDDELLCKFTKNGTCFKGSRCKLKHLNKIESGWTRDQSTIIIDIQSKIIYPKIGELIRIIPTHILSVVHFYARIEDDPQYKITLRELAFKMNSEDEICNYRKYVNCIPVKFELVIAKYSDGLFYRAKVMSSTCTTDEYLQIFYVDYGNIESVSLSDLRFWEQKFAYLPFQAVNFHLAGIRVRANDYNLVAQKYLHETIVNCIVQAKVINNQKNELRVLVYLSDGDDNMFELNKELVRLGYAEEFCDYDSLCVQSNSIAG